MLLVIIYFSFLNVYNQNVRSSTIEPFFESLPDHLREVNPSNTFIIFLESLDIASGLRLPTIAARDKTACNTWPNRFYDILKDINIANIGHILKIIAKRSDIVAVTSKTSFHHPLVFYLKSRYDRYDKKGIKM